MSLCILFQLCNSGLRGMKSAPRAKILPRGRELFLSLINKTGMCCFEECVQFGQKGRYILTIIFLHRVWFSGELEERINVSLFLAANE